VFEINKNAVCIDFDNITITISTTAFAIANSVMLGNIYWRIIILTHTTKQI